MLRAAAKNFARRGGGGRSRRLPAAPRAARPRGRDRRGHPPLPRAEGLPPHRALRGRHRRLLRAGGGEGRRASRWRRREDVFPYRLALSFEKVQDLRYGENPHQRAAFYSDLGSTLYSVAAARKLQGKELSFNNILDLDAAWRLVDRAPGAGLRDRQAHEPLRHRRSGAGPLRGLRARVGVRPHVRLRRHRRLQPPAWTPPTARALGERFVEAVIAPGFEAEAKKALAAEEEPARDGHGHDRPSTSVTRLRPAPRDGRPARAGVGPAPARPQRSARSVTQAQAHGRGVEGAAPGLDGGEAREVERDRLRDGGADGRRGRGPDEPRRRGALRGPEGAAAA